MTLPVTITISGPTGAGKTVLCRIIKQALEANEEFDFQNVTLDERPLKIGLVSGETYALAPTPPEKRTPGVIYLANPTIVRLLNIYSDGTCRVEKLPSRGEYLIVAHSDLRHY